MSSETLTMFTLIPISQHVPSLPVVQLVPIQLLRLQPTLRDLLITPLSYRRYAVST